MSELKQLINERIEALRPKLQDTSRRNPLSKSFRLQLCPLQITPAEY